MCLVYAKIETMVYQAVFMGSSDFSVTIMEELARNFPVSGVVTQPDKPAGRGKQLTPPPVKRKALELGLPVFQPEKLNTPQAIEQLQAWQPDFIVVAAYGKILRQNVLDLPRFGCVNVHASYLPRWRGASPIQAAILHGDRSSGITIMVMDAGVDTGSILARQSVPIEKEENSITLSHKLAVEGAPLLSRALSAYLSGKLLPFAQEFEGATYAPMIRKEEGKLDFNQPAQLLERKVRAYIDWPGAAMIYDDQLLMVRKARVIPGAGIAGTRMVIDHYPCVVSSDGILMLMEVKPAGRNWMSGADFLRGARSWAT